MGSFKRRDILVRQAIMEILHLEKQGKKPIGVVVRTKYFPNWNVAFSGYINHIVHDNAIRDEPIVVCEDDNVMRLKYGI